VGGVAEKLEVRRIGRRRMKIWFNVKSYIDSARLYAESVKHDETAIKILKIFTLDVVGFLYSDPESMRRFTSFIGPEKIVEVYVYVCPICGREFMNASSVRIHIKAEHEEVGGGEVQKT
jgi:hypothetical protein